MFLGVALLLFLGIGGIEGGGIGGVGLRWGGGRGHQGYGGRGWGGGRGGGWGVGHQGMGGMGGRWGGGAYKDRSCTDDHDCQLGQRMGQSGATAVCVEGKCRRECSNSGGENQCLPQNADPNQANNNRALRCLPSPEGDGKYFCGECTIATVDIDCKGNTQVMHLIMNHFLKFKTVCLKD